MENIFLRRDFSNTETLCSEQKYYCETCCSKQEAQKRCVKGFSPEGGFGLREGTMSDFESQFMGSWPSSFGEVSCLPPWRNKDKNATLGTCPFV